MKFSENQIKFIIKHTNRRYIDQENLIEYLENHEIIKKDVFKICSRKKFNKNRIITEDELYGFDTGIFNYFEEMDRELFFNRIPFMFYVPQKPGYDPDIHNISSSIRISSLEDFFDGLEFLYYDMKFSIDDIVTYPTRQVNEPRKENTDSSTIDFSAISEVVNPRKNSRLYTSRIFIQWVHYVKLCVKMNSTDFFPRCFITGYNMALEKSGLEPIMYSPTGNIYDCFTRMGEYFYCDGVFPRDENNNVILKWVNIKIFDEDSYSYTGEYSLPGELTIKITPKTRIYIKDADNDEWYSVYSGPLNMEFNFSELKEARKRKGYTQQQVSDAIGVAVRTFQKWEKGDTCPDGFHLIRIMNWLEIENVQSLITLNDFE